MSSSSPYPILKRLARRAIPNSVLLTLEEPLRWVYSLPYRGQGQECPICGSNLRRFIRLPRTTLCPRCGSGARDRRLWLMVERLLKERRLSHDSQILDFSPSRCLYRRFKLRFPNYVASDFAGEFIGDQTYDITAIPEVDGQFDLVICYHILEHVPDDRAAMQELFRVLRPGGQVLIQTPFSDSGMIEDPGIISPEGRLEHFGQEDHVRIYSVEGLTRRLQEEGFKTDVLHFDAATAQEPVPSRLTQFSLLENERIVVAIKK